MATPFDITRLYTDTVEAAIDTGMETVNLIVEDCGANYLGRLTYSDAVALARFILENLEGVDGNDGTYV